jgi:hypothetical protein
MKYLIALILSVAMLFQSGCCVNKTTGTKYVCVLGPNSCVYKQAFAIAIRSLEGSALARDATRIPAALQALADSWLPSGNQYTDFIRGIIDDFVAAHPVTPAQVNQVLEALAVKVQSGC